MKFIGKLAATPDKHLKLLLHQHLSRVEEGRPYTRLHASALTYEDREFCPREFALGGLLKAKPKDERLTTSLNVTFELGRLLQDRVVNWFADMGRAVGDWVCLACNWPHRHSKRPVGCTKCGCKAFKPEEVRFTSQTCGASCGIDMMVDLKEPKLIAVELKTMAADEFKKLQAPLAEHKLRTTLYLRLIADDTSHPMHGMVNTSRAKILYVSKNGFGCADDQLAEWGVSEKFSPFKEFEVERDDEMVEPYWQRARMVTDYRNKEAGMPAGVCPTSLCSRAKMCPVRTPCFSGQYPAEVFS